MTEQAIDTHVGPGRAAAARAPHMPRLLPAVVSLHLLLIPLQALTAGLFLSGEGRAVQGHQIGAQIIMVVAITQAVLATLYWRRGGPRWFFIASLLVLVMEVLQMGAGYNKIFWAHLPLGVGLFGGLTRQQMWVLSQRRPQAQKQTPTSQSS
jgi:hypothetical protein